MSDPIPESPTDDVVIRGHALIDVSQDSNPGGWWWACSCGGSDGPYPDSITAHDGWSDVHA